MSLVQPQYLPRIGVIFLGRKRPGFDMEWGRQMEQRVRDLLGRLPIEVYEPQEKAVDDQTLRCAVDLFRKQRVDSVAVLQSTMGDGRLAPTLAQLWPDPLLLWATPENPQGEMISSCSLVGAHCWASVLRQMGHGFELVYGDPDCEATQTRFLDAVRLATTVARLRTARLGIIGGQSPGYFAMSADPFMVHHGLGVQLQTFSLVEFGNVVNGLGEDEVRADVARVKSLGIPHKDTTDEDLPMASRLYLAMRQFIEAERLDALSVRCWPEMPNTFGQWPYLGMARLADEGFAIACEGDADGALSAWVGESLGMGRCYLSDWLEHDSRTITLWHGGAAPPSLSPRPDQPGGPRIARHFNIKKPAVVEAEIRSDMPVTVMRLWHCDGAYYLTAREGQTVPPRRRLMASHAVAELNDQNPHEWFEELCHRGMPHHVAVFAGHHADRLRRLARLLQMETI